jgi:hypothetical protein
MMNIYEEGTLNFWICRQTLSPSNNKQEKSCTILDMSLISRSCKNDHIIFNVGTASLEARNIRLVNIITYIIEESKLISAHIKYNMIIFA